MKSLIISTLLLLATHSFADTVTSTIDGTIKYVPPKNSIVKKGDILVRYSTSGINLKIKILKVKIKIAEEELKDLKTDFKRSKILNSKSIISIATHEDIVYSYNRCLLECEKLNLEMEDLERILGKHIIKAPYGCKVTKTLIVPNSGVEQGDGILEVEII